MNPETAELKRLRAENSELLSRLTEAEEALNAIRNGEVDAVIVSGEDGEKVFSLTSAETPYRIVIEEMNQGAATLLADGTIIYCNRRFSELLDVPPGNLLGKNFQDLIPDPVLPVLRDLITAGMAGNTNGEIPYTSNSGQVRYFHLLFSPLPSAMTGDLCVLASDITDRKNFEAALKQSSDLLEVRVMERTAELSKTIEDLDASRKQMMDLTEDLVRTQDELQASKKRYQDLYENAPDMYLSIEPVSGIIMQCNKKVLELTGYAENEIIGRPVFELYHPDCLPGVREAFLRFISQGELKDTELAVCCKNGAVIEVTLNASAVRDDAGKIVMSRSIWRDITRRRETERTLQETETSFRNLFETMSEGVALHELIYDAQNTAVDYRILKVNPAFQRHTGLIPEVIVGKPATEVYEMADPPFLEIYAKTAFPGKSFSFENYFPPLGKHFRISVSSPKKNQFVTVFEDITERKKTEHELLVSLSKYKVLFDSFPVGITVSDPGGQIVESNTFAETLLGLSRKVHETRSIDGDEWQIVRPDGTPMSSSEFASVRALREHRQIDNVEMGIVKGRNNITWINVSAAPIPLEGYGVVITYYDISERKRIEDRLHETNAYLENLINYANAPIIVWDPGFRITRFNHAFEYLTGRTEAEVTGQSLEILFPPELVDHSMALILKTQGGERWETVEIKIRHRDGSVRTVLWNSATLFMPDGVTPVATIAQGQDITRRKNAENELSLTNEALLKTIAEKDKFFSIIAHDLRSPFSSFLGFTRMMADELPTLTLDQIQTIAVKMRKSASNLYDLLENLLEWSRLQRDLIMYEPSEFLLVQKISDSLSSVYEAAHQKEITIKQEIDNTIEVYADEKMVATLIRNLTSNAVKFTPRGGEITLFAKRLPEDDHVEISVADTGIGMSREMIEGLFRLETKTGRKGTENEPSTGLGLVICKDFAEQHGGNIRVESEEGHGSTFYFTLPVKKIHPAAQG